MHRSQGLTRGQSGSPQRPPQGAEAQVTASRRRGSTSVGGNSIRCLEPRGKSTAGIDALLQTGRVDIASESDAPLFRRACRPVGQAGHRSALDSEPRESPDPSLGDKSPGSLMVLEAVWHDRCEEACLWCAIPEGGEGSGMCAMPHKFHATRATLEAQDSSSVAPRWIREAEKIERCMSD
jgi:hypothetical protein